MPERPDYNKKSLAQTCMHKSRVHHPVRDAFGAFSPLANFRPYFLTLYERSKCSCICMTTIYIWQTMSRSCHRSNQNVLVTVPLHARNPLLHIPLPSTDFISDKHLIHARNSLPSGNDIFCLNLNPLTFPSLHLTHNPPLLLQSEFLSAQCHAFIPIAFPSLPCLQLACGGLFLFSAEFICTHGRPPPLTPPPVNKLCSWQAPHSRTESLFLNPYPPVRRFYFLPQFELWGQSPFSVRVPFFSQHLRS